MQNIFFFTQFLLIVLKHRFSKESLWLTWWNVTGATDTRLVRFVCLYHGHYLFILSFTVRHCLCIIFTLHVVFYSVNVLLCGFAYMYSQKASRVVHRVCSNQQFQRSKSVLIYTSLSNNLLVCLLLMTSLSLWMKKWRECSPEWKKWNLLCIR